MNSENVLKMQKYANELNYIIYKNKTQMRNTDVCSRAYAHTLSLSLSLETFQCWQNIKLKECKNSI
jgi:hypothetical protein